MGAFEFIALATMMFAYAMFFYVLGIITERRQPKQSLEVPRFVNESGPPSRRLSR